MTSAQVYQWEFVDPNHPELGKKQSDTLAPDGATANIDSFIGLLGRNLTKAYLPGFVGPQYRVRTTVLNDAYLPGAELFNLQGDGLTARDADFTSANLERARLENADLSDAVFRDANLSDSWLEGSTLAGADLTGANVFGARFERTTAGGFTPSQFYSSATYQSGDLGPVNFSQNDLTGWDFTGRRIDGGNFTASNLGEAIFDDASIRDAVFDQTDLAPAQLYATASYQSGSLGRIELTGSDLSGWSFAGIEMRSARLVQSDLSNANFDGADLASVSLGIPHVEFAGTSFRGADLSGARFESNARWRGADFTNANLEGARLASNNFAESDFTGAVIKGATLDGGFTLANLYQTASYQLGDLTEIAFSGNTWRGADFSGKDVSHSRFGSVQLDGATFEGATAVGTDVSIGSFDAVSFDYANLRDARIDWTALSDISFRGADLTFAELVGTTIGAFDLTDAIIYGSSFETPAPSIGLTETQLYSTASYQAGSLGPIRLKGDFRGWDFSGQDMAGAAFRRDSQLGGAEWGGAVLSGAEFFVASLPGADFRTTVLDGVRLIASNAANADFRGVDLSQAEIGESDLQSTRLQGTVFRNAIVDRVDLAGANLAGADLRHARFSKTDFTNADVTGADIRHTDLTRADDDGFTVAMLESTASFANGDLTGTNLVSWELPGVDFRGFVLRGTILHQADLSGADMRAIDATGAGLGANLTGVDLEGATLNGANVGGAVGVSSANLANASIRYADFSNTDLTQQQLASTASYQQRDLQGFQYRNGTMPGVDFKDFNLRDSGFSLTDLTAADFAGADLRGASFRSAVLALTDFNDARIEGASFERVTDFGFDETQFESTTSFRKRSLARIDLSGNDLIGWDFTEQDLRGTKLFASDATGASFDRADLRGADLIGLPSGRQPNPIVVDPDAFDAAISPEGELPNLLVGAGERLVVRNVLDASADESSLTSIRVTDSVDLDPEATLSLVLNDDAWRSTIVIESGVDQVQLLGSLELAFHEAAIPESNIGRTFALFDWFSAPIGQFEVVSNARLVWDLSDLYTTGEATLLSVYDAMASDFNDDGRVNAADYTLLRDAFGQSGADLAADVDGDGVVDDSDLAIWKASYGASDPSRTALFAVPEPGSLATAVLCVLGVFGCTTTRQSYYRSIRGLPKLADASVQ